MSLRLGAVLALLAQTIPLAGPGAFFVCVHEDGDVQYELAAKPCCESGSSAGPETDSERSDAGEIGGVPGCDHCRDYSASFLQVHPSGGGLKSALAFDEAFAPAVPLVAILPSIPAFLLRGFVNSAGPPGARTILTHLSTVVLQV